MKKLYNGNKGKRAGGRPAVPPETKFKKLTVTVPPDLWEKLQALPNISSAVAQALKNFFGKC